MTALQTWPATRAIPVAFGLEMLLPAALPPRADPRGPAAPGRVRRRARPRRRRRPSCSAAPARSRAHRRRLQRRNPPLYTSARMPEETTDVAALFARLKEEVRAAGPRAADVTPAQVRL